MSAYIWRIPGLNLMLLCSGSCGSLPPDISPFGHTYFLTYLDSGFIILLIIFITVFERLPVKVRSIQL
jgi:hypothetical protein